MLHGADLVAGEFRRSIVNIGASSFTTVIFDPTEAQNINILLPVFNFCVPMFRLGLVLGLVLRLGRLAGSRLLLILRFFIRNRLLLFWLLTARFCRVGGACGIGLLYGINLVHSPCNGESILRLDVGLSGGLLPCDGRSAFRPDGKRFA